MWFNLYLAYCVNLAHMPDFNFSAYSKFRVYTLKFCLSNLTNLINKI